jgi:hypothetical protein
MLERLRLELDRALRRFRHVPPLEIARLYARALRLHMRGTEIRLRPALARPERIVVTLTSIPARLPYLLPVLRSLIDQDEPANRIVLALPHQSRRDQSFYPDPSHLGLPAGVDVLRCRDEGPATKLLPALRVEGDALLVVVDDDVIYPRGFLRTLLAAHRRNPAAAIGYRGVRLVPGRTFGDLRHVFATDVGSDDPVDILFGTWGYLIPPHALDEAVQDFSGYPEGMRLVDDVWISGHLARRGVSRLVAPAMQIPIETFASFRAALTRGPNRSGINDAMAIDAFHADWRPTETRDHECAECP